MKKGTAVMWAALVLLILIKFFFGGTSLATLAVFIWSAAVSAYLLVRNGLPEKKHLITSAVLTAVVLGVCLMVYNSPAGTVLFTVTTCLSALAVFSAGEKNEDIRFIRSADAKSILISVLIGAAAAVPLIVINTAAMSSGSTAAPEFSIIKVIWALQPGIAEETAFRAVFMAMCLYLSGGKMTKGQSIMTYIMMSVPHGLWHGSMNIAGCMLAAAVFGLPFAVLQRKRDITSAIVSHFLVDAARFIIFGG